MRNTYDRRRILLVSPRWGHLAGGSETLLRAYAQRLANSERFDVDIATTCALSEATWDNELLAGEFVEGNLRLHRFPARSPNRGAAFLFRQAFRNPYLIRFLARLPLSVPSVTSPELIDFIRRERTRYETIVSAPYLHGTTVETVLTAPERSVIFPCLHDEPAARMGGVGTLLRSAHGRIFNSQVERDLARRYHGEAAAVGPVIGIGIDYPAEIAPEEKIRSEFGLVGDYLVYVGRRIPQKGVDRLVSALLEHNNHYPERAVMLILVGDGSYLPPRDRMFRAVGYVDEPTKHGLLAAALANISFSRMESLSIVLLESWLLGTPAIVDGTGAVLDWQVRRSGGGVSVRSVEDLADAIALMRIPDRRAGMAAAGRRLVTREYTWQTVLAALTRALGVS